MTSLDLPTQWPLVAPLAMLLIALGWYLINRGRTRASRINLEDLLLGDDGRISNSKFFHLCSWIMATWLIVYLAVSGQLSEGYFVAYIGAFVAPAVAQALKSKPEGQAPLAQGVDER